MGITYQTSNRLRRKVQTAPLPALADGDAAAQAVVEKRKGRWVLPLALALAAAALGALAMVWR